MLLLMLLLMWMMMMVINTARECSVKTTMEVHYQHDPGLSFPKILEQDSRTTQHCCPHDALMLLLEPTILLCFMFLFTHAPLQIQREYPLLCIALLLLIYVP